MKPVRFFSRVTLICNICFILFVIFSQMEAARAVTGTPGTVERVPYFKELIIILGFPAIIINFLMCLCYFILIVLGKNKLVPKWLGFINITFLFAQVFYFFFYKI